MLKQVQLHVGRTVEETSCPEKTKNCETSLSRYEIFENALKFAFTELNALLGIQPECIYFSPMQGQLHEKTIFEVLLLIF